MNDDDPLLQTLAQAMAPSPEEPSAAELAALRRAVARTFGRAPSLPWWRRRPAMLLAAATMCAGAALAVMGVALPTPTRRLAHAVGLPVDSEAVVETRALAARLRASLAARDRAAIERALPELRAKVDGLSEPDLRALGGDVVVALVEAELFEVAPEPAPPGPRRAVKKAVGQGPEVDDDEPEDDAPIPPAPPVCAEDAEDVIPPPPPVSDEAHERASERAHELLQRATDRASEALDRAAEQMRERAERETERAERETERAERETERAEKAREEREEAAERAAEKAQEEAERAREKAQEEAEKAQEKIERERERIERERERVERERRQNSAPEPPSAPDDD